MLTKKMFTAATIAVAFTLASCNKELNKSSDSVAQQPDALKVMMAENGVNPDEASITGMQSVSTERTNGDNHYLYTETNSLGTNDILVYKIEENGSLHHMATVASGGAGTGKGLGSQGALVLDESHNWLYAVNAGSNSVSSFKINHDGSLTLAHTAGTKGSSPVSVTVYDNMLYVLNSGTDNIHGFWIGNGGSLTSINGSTESLSGTAVDAPQISFSPYGDQVIVTEKATNIIGTFKIKKDGSVVKGVFTPSVGATPFGFAFSRDKYMVVSNAAGGAAGAGSATSYILNNGIPYNVTAAVPDFQAAPCWFAITKYGRFAYTTNTASNNISSYYVSPGGGLYLVQGIAATTNTQPLDIVVAANNYFVYELNGTGQSIGGYHRKFLGGLELIGNEAGIPASSTGLATY